MRQWAATKRDQTVAMDTKKPPVPLLRLSVESIDECSGGNDTEIVLVPVLELPVVEGVVLQKDDATSATDETRVEVERKGTDSNAGAKDNASRGAQLGREGAPALTEQQKTRTGGRRS